MNYQFATSHLEFLRDMALQYEMEVHFFITANFELRLNVLNFSRVSASIVLNFF